MEVRVLSAAPVFLAFIGMLLAACERHQPIVDYIATPIADKQRLESARNEALEAALAMVRSCLQGRDKCDGVVMDPELARQLRPWASKLAASRVEAISEQDDRKVAVLFSDRPGELTVAINIHLRRGEPVKVSVSQLIVD